MNSSEEQKTNNNEELYGEDETDFAEVIRAKWAIDGATTLSEAAQMLKTYAEWLEDLESQGWQLRNEVRDDYGFLQKFDNEGVIDTDATLSI